MKTEKLFLEPVYEYIDEILQDGDVQALVEVLQKATMEYLPSDALHLNSTEVERKDAAWDLSRIQTLIRLIHKAEIQAGAFNAGATKVREYVKENWETLTKPQ